MSRMVGAWSSDRPHPATVGAGVAPADFFNLLASRQLRGCLVGLRNNLFGTVSDSFHVIRVPGGAPCRSRLS